ncbi:cystathionine gamma-synthase [Rhodovulum bhavnagarense]|uniref:Cystathionine gamma-synthase n=1 Tax=Rhodovulum bhavnagarense TaxID=992286 RepID=A0A4R2RNM7_9RHOB|nr:aminotransferase class I/II-fold pyridoxal phosphate-dependent enzyme [Rhodovulum bhavnagarense]TCP61401.1 cystathionine gamma-synthase [Rhodovulum bhavnagarense]
MSNDPHIPARRRRWPEGGSRPVATPLNPSVVYATPDPDALDAQYEGRSPGYSYAREGHPNADVLAQMLDRLEGGTGGVLTGSGMAALGAAVLASLRAGDHVLGGDQLYGRSLRMLAEDLPRLGIASSLADPTDAERFAAALRPETRMILVETVSNPTLRVADIAGIAELAKERGILLAVDNTFTTPRAIRPLAHGADIVIQSVTKLLAGHADATLGYVVARDPLLGAAMRTAATTWGLTPSPFDCWLAERGLLSFELRHDRASENAARLADHLAGQAGVARVLYPGRADHPDHARAGELFGCRFGNMLSFEIKGGRAAANAFTRACPNIAFAPTLGDISTTLSHPASSSHRALGAEGRAAMGIGEGFFRVSVGIEPVETLMEEMARGVAASLTA